MSRLLRIGCGAGYSGDRIEPAVELAEHGRLDYLVFESPTRWRRPCSANPWPVSCGVR